MAEERDEPRLMDLFRRAAAKLSLPVSTWSSIQSLVRDGFAAQYGTQDAGRALAFLSQVPDPGVFLFMDVLPALSNPV